MGEALKFDKRIRNIALIIIAIATILLFIWIVIFSISPKNASPLLISIGLALLLGGILLFTRIQYIIWAKKTYNLSNHESENLGIK
ncbi:MAG: hypothetical protein ACFFDT_10075 [Candidatus Hodarchaeota archaeon]